MSVDMEVWCNLRPTNSLPGFQRPRQKPSCCWAMWLVGTDIYLQRNSEIKGFGVWSSNDFKSFPAPSCHLLSEILCLLINYSSSLPAHQRSLPLMSEMTCHLSESQLEKVNTNRHIYISFFFFLYAKKGKKNLSFSFGIASSNGMRELCIKLWNSLPIFRAKCRKDGLARWLSG